MGFTTEHQTIDSSPNHKLNWREAEGLSKNPFRFSARGPKRRRASFFSWLGGALDPNFAPGRVSSMVKDSIRRTCLPADFQDANPCQVVFGYPIGPLCGGSLFCSMAGCFSGPRLVRN